MSGSLSTSWASFEKLATKANRRNKKIVFEALAEAGITHVCVGFDGEGDQGQMERASAQTDGKTVEFPSVKLTLQIAEFGGTKLTAREMNLREAVEQLCYDYLEHKEGGWENDGGSFGEFVFDVAAGTITLEFNRRFVTFDYNSYTF